MCQIDIAVGFSNAANLFIICGLLKRFLYVEVFLNTMFTMLRFDIILLCRLSIIVLVCFCNICYR